MIVTNTDTVITVIVISDGRSPSDVSSTSAMSIVSTSPTCYANGTRWGHLRVTTLKLYSVLLTSNSCQGKEIRWTFQRYQGRQSIIKCNSFGTWESSESRIVLSLLRHYHKESSPNHRAQWKHICDGSGSSHFWCRGERFYFHNTRRV